MSNKSKPHDVVKDIFQGTDERWICFTCHEIMVIWENQPKEQKDTMRNEFVAKHGETAGKTQ